MRLWQAQPLEMTDRFVDLCDEVRTEGFQHKPIARAASRHDRAYMTVHEQSMTADEALDRHCSCESGRANTG